MFKKLKKTAWQMVLHNYKRFFLVTVLLLTAQTARNLVINNVSAAYVWLHLSDAVKLLALIILLLSEFVCVPICATVIFKTSILLRCKPEVGFKTEMCDFLNRSNIGKVILLGIVPGVLNLYLEINNAELSVFRTNIFEFKGAFLFVLMVLSTLLQWAMYAVYFGVALYGTTVKETVLKAVAVLKTGLGSFILLMLSFILWTLATTVLYGLTGIALYGIDCFTTAGSTPILETLKSFGMGINLIFVPYLYTAFALFFEERFEARPKGKVKNQ